jgi:hypothetical protein
MTPGLGGRSAATEALEDGRHVGRRKDLKDYSAETDEVS